MKWIITQVFALVSHFSYLAVFLILVVCGLGLPIPEEITLIASGYVAYAEKTHWGWMVLVCLLAILVGDLLTYHIGRHYGMRVFRSRFFRKLLTEDRLDTVQSWYRKYGSWTVFFSRFVAGVRFCSYFTAGTMRVPILTFCFMDLLGGLVSVPISVWAGHYFAKDIDHGIRWVKKFNHSVAVGAVVVALCLLAYRYWVRRRAAVPVSPSAQPPPPPVVAVAPAPLDAPAPPPRA